MTMRIKKETKDGVLRLTLEDVALVGAPDWQSVEPLRQEGAALVALDLKAARFVSSLFLAACVELRRELVERGRTLVLMHVASHHKRVLELVDGAAQLPIVQTEDQLMARLAELNSAQGNGRGGVGHTEKSMLWG
jgi:anti-anti-sigma regulatory factor